MILLRIYLKFRQSVIHKKGNTTWGVIAVCFLIQTWTGQVQEKVLLPVQRPGSQHCLFPGHPFLASNATCSTPLTSSPLCSASSFSCKLYNGSSAEFISSKAFVWSLTSPASFSLHQSSFFHLIVPLAEPPELEFLLHISSSKYFPIFPSSPQHLW